MPHETNPQECCPEFSPEKWDQKTHHWENKNFIKESIPAFFHMPLPSMIGKKITKMLKAIEREGKMAAEKLDVLILFTDPHPFKSEIYFSTEGEVPGENNVRISGEFISKVFDGPYNAIPKFLKEMNKYLSEQNKKAKKYYVHYAYCPKCAKKFGHNYMVFFAEV